MDGESVTFTLVDTWDGEVSIVHNKLLNCCVCIAKDIPTTKAQGPFSAMFAVLQDEGGWAQEQCMLTGDAFLLVYSITDRASFLRASELRISLRCLRPAHHTPIILVGNKCDLVRSREVSISGECSRVLLCDVELFVCAN